MDKSTYYVKYDLVLVTQAKAGRWYRALANARFREVYFKIKEALGPKHNITLCIDHLLFSGQLLRDATKCSSMYLNTTEQIRATWLFLPTRPRAIWPQLIRLKRGLMNWEQNFFVDWEETYTDDGNG